MSNVYKIGRLVQLGLAKETTRGTTPASASYWLAWDDLTLEEQRKTVADDAAYGIIEGMTGNQQVKRWSEGTIKAPVVDTSFGLILYSMFGGYAHATHSGETTVYDHTFTVAESAQHQSLSLYMHDASIQDYSFGNCIVHKLDIDYQLEKFVSYTASVMGLKGVAQTAYTPSQTVENRFPAPYLTFKVAANVAGLSGATAIPIKSAKISIDGNAESFDVLGSLDPADFFNKEFKVSGTIEAIFRNEADFKTAFLASTAQAMLLDLNNTGVLLGTAAHPEVAITLDQVYITKLGLPRKVKDLVYQTVSFDATYSVTNTEMIKIVLTNVLSAY